MDKKLLSVSLRQRALYLPQAKEKSETAPSALALATELRQLGFTLSEDLLHALSGFHVEELEEVLDVINDVMGTHLNWSSLVKGWLVPTEETIWDHFLTLIANVTKEKTDWTGTTLPCGHFIPEGTFPLERYNGCPFCGKPFHTTNYVFKGQGTKLRVLQLWGDTEMRSFLRSLLLSPVPLDATQRESLVHLLHSSLAAPVLTEVLKSPSLIIVKETRMLVADELITMERDDEAGQLFSTPSDILRYLWYRHTGRVQLLRPATLLYMALKNYRHECNTNEDIAGHVAEEQAKLKLKYSRKWCLRVAIWLNKQANCSPSTLNDMLETMHPQRPMWVRFIRGLRLGEYARRPGFEHLQTLLDRFYRQDYTVWKGRVESYWQLQDAPQTLLLLQQRPGLFARCLFSAMLTFGWEPVIEAFQRIVLRVPTRLILTLGTQADLYFDRGQQRVVRPLSGVVKQIAPNPKLALFTDAQLEQMKQAVGQLYLDTLRQKFRQQASDAKTIFIDPQLYNIPVAVGDRSATVQDISATLQGTRFPVNGDAVRLFLQWGKDLPAQHLDMDLSCYILTDSDSYVCSYFNLSPTGAKHSGDIQCIPDLVGTAEYIELSLPELEAAGARRVVFTCNAYSEGSLSPNLVVGWMSADKPMTVSESTGVAYDPSTVDHMVRITETDLSKGLIFGVLEVSKREITWLEMAFDGQTILSINPQTVDTFLRRLRAKPTIGQALAIKAEAQGQAITDDANNADEVFTQLWAQNTAEVSRLLLD